MKRKTILISTISAIAVLLAIYAGGGMYYQNRFLPKTTIASIDISGNTVEEAQRKIAQKLHAQEITVTEKDKELLRFKPSDLEASVDETSTLKQAKEEQGSWGWPVQIFQNKNISAETSQVAFNEDKLNSLLETLAADEENRVPSENAGIVNQDGKFAIQKEVQGTMVDQEALKEKMVQSLAEGTDQVALEDVYVRPAVTSEDKNLQESLAKMERLANTAITYTIAGHEEVVPKEKIAEWLTVDGEGNPAINQEAAEAYLETLHEKYATNEKTRQFQSTNRGTIEVPAGTYGWSIATTTEAENLAGYILAGEDITVTPAINGSGYHDDGTDIGSSYVEVDLEAQKMYLYKNGEKVLETVIVGGHPKTPTPIGVFYAWNKVQDTKLVGYNPRREADYETPVKYWIPIDWEGIGIHDADWQGSFASDEYLVNGSNGCINTPPGVMDQFFAGIDEGMPVVIF